MITLAWVIPTRLRVAKQRETLKSHGWGGRYCSDGRSLRSKASDGVIGVTVELVLGFASDASVPQFSAVDQAAYPWGDPHRSACRGLGPMVTHPYFTRFGVGAPGCRTIQRVPPGHGRRLRCTNASRTSAASRSRTSQPLF
jgi:hypothetical protein